MTPIARGLAPAAFASLLALGACDGGTAPPEPGEGAVGMVTTEGAGAAQTPTTPALPGGPAGQTPDYGQPGGVGSQVQTQPDGAGPSSGSGDPPLN